MLFLRFLVWFVLLVYSVFVCLAYFEKAGRTEGGRAHSGGVS